MPELALLFAIVRESCEQRKEHWIAAGRGEEAVRRPGFKSKLCHLMGSLEDKFFILI